LLLRVRRAKCIAVSHQLKVWPTDTRPFIVIENPVSTSVDELQLESNTRIKRLVYIGRFANPEKRPELVFELCLQTGLPGLMIGDGKERAPLMQLTDISKIDIEFPGQVINPWSYLRPGDLLVIPSKFEGDGLVLVEAILNRIPLLVSDIPEFRRFSLPEEFYNSNREDFQKKILDFSNSLQELRVPDEIREKISISRRPDIIAVFFKLENLEII
jgi:Glycosyl transferases group 1